MKRWASSPTVAILNDKINSDVSLSNDVHQEVWICTALDVEGQFTQIVLAIIGQ